MSTKKFADRSPAWRLIASAGLLAASLGTAVDAQAAGYLQAQGGISALGPAGGPSGGYNLVVSPATSAQSAIGHDAVEATAGSFVAGGANLWGQATAASSATFGELAESSSAQARGYSAYVIAGTGTVASYATDIFTVHGSGNISVTLNTELRGGNVIGDATAGNALVRTSTGISPSGYTNNSQIITLSDVVGANAAYVRPASASIVAHEGDTFRITASLNQETSIQLLNGALDVPGLRTVGATTQATLDYWVTLSAGATLVSDSGWSYRAPSAAVPEPPAAALLLLGLLALVRRQRQR